MAQQDAAAFALLYERYVESIYAFCFQRLGSRELAEDATSQVFTNALAALPRYRAGSFRGWLYAIARNVVTDERRRPVALPETRAASHDAALHDAESDIDLRRLLACLTDEQRDVVELRLAGLTGPEIAEATGKRPGAVRAIQFRAYQRLREILAEKDMEQ